MTAEDTVSETSATEPSDRPEIDLTPAPPAKKVLPTAMAPPAAFEDADAEDDEKMSAETESIRPGRGRRMVLPGRGNHGPSRNQIPSHEVGVCCDCSGGQRVKIDRIKVHEITHSRHPI